MCNYEIRETGKEPVEFMYSGKSLFPSNAARFSKEAVVLEAVDSEKTIGCVVYTFFKKGQTTGLKRKPYYPGNGVYIERIKVSEDYEGNGLGKDLMEACKKDARKRNSDFIFAEIDPEATGFFEKCGMRLDVSEVGSTEEEIIYGIQYIGDLK